MDNKAEDFIKAQVLKLERNTFIIKIILIVAGYAGITFWLNSIRTTAALWFVWALIIVQFALYFSIFISCCRRSIVFGLQKTIAIILFIVFAILGRVNNWELFIIPLVAITMIIYSVCNKRISDRGKSMLSNSLSG
jgi:hypothetical protein